MIEAYKKFWTNYANFKGRSTRSDYWWTVLANILVTIILSILTAIVGPKVGTTIIGLFSLAIIIPTVAIIVRRFHDINKSGWFYCCVFIPFVGAILVLIWLLTPSVNENNNYGEIVK